MRFNDLDILKKKWVFTRSEKYFCFTILLINKLQIIKN